MIETEIITTAEIATGKGAAEKERGVGIGTEIGKMRAFPAGINNIEDIDRKATWIWMILNKFKSNREGIEMLLITMIFD